MVERLFLIGAGAGSAETNIRSRSKVDRLRNTVSIRISLIRMHIGTKIKIKLLKRYERVQDANA